MRLDWLTRVQGFVFDALLIGVAAAVAEDKIQDWLFANPKPLFHGLVLLHVITIPALLVALVTGYGKSGRLEEINRRTPGVLGWTAPMLWCGSFIIPGVLGLNFSTSTGEIMAAVFGPIAVFILWMCAILMAEKHGYIPPARIGEAKPWWGIQGLALLSWAYLLWLETMLISAASRPGPLATVGLPLGVLIDYLPIRIVLYYIRDDVPRWEIATMALGALHLMYRIMAA